MNVIYSKTRVDGLNGRYIAPNLFAGVIRGAKVCYTDSEVIAGAYEAKGIKVLPLTEAGADLVDSADFTEIAGVGKATADKIKGAGIATFEQLANIDEDLANALGIKQDVIDSAREKLEGAE
jgi:hypothetical protein